MKLFRMLLRGFLVVAILGVVLGGATLQMGCDDAEEEENGGSSCTIGDTKCSSGGMGIDTCVEGNVWTLTEDCSESPYPPDYVCQDSGTSVYCGPPPT